MKITRTQTTTNRSGDQLTAIQTGMTSRVWNHDLGQEVAKALTFSGAVRKMDRLARQR